MGRWPQSSAIEASQPRQSGGGQRPVRLARGPPRRRPAPGPRRRLFGLAYAGFAAGAISVPAIAPWFVASGMTIGCAERAEHAAVAALVPLSCTSQRSGCWSPHRSFELGRGRHGI